MTGNTPSGVMAHDKLVKAARREKDPALILIICWKMKYGVWVSKDVRIARYGVQREVIRCVNVIARIAGRKFESEVEWILYITQTLRLWNKRLTMLLNAG